MRKSNFINLWCNFYILAGFEKFILVQNSLSEKSVNASILFERETALAANLTELQNHNGF